MTIFSIVSHVFEFSHAVFAMFLACDFYPFLSSSGVLPQTHHTQQTAHNTHTHHTAQDTCLVLILVVMAPVSGQAIVVVGGLAGMSLKGGSKKPELAKLLCETSGADVEWLLDRFTLDLSLVARLSGHSALTVVRSVSQT